MIQDPRVGCTQVPLHYPGRRVRTEEYQGGGQFRSSQEICLLLIFLFVFLRVSLILIVGMKVIK